MMVAASSPLIRYYAVCMTLFSFTRRIPAVASSSFSFFAHQVGFVPPVKKLPSPVIDRCSLTATTNSRRISSFVNHRYPKASIIATAIKRNMSTSLKNSQESGEGLSDIGTQSSNKNINSNSKATTMPNWKERIDISIAKSRKIRGSNYVQISTIDYESMEPRCRTVVFRGFMKDVPFDAVKEFLGSGGEGGEGSEDRYDCVMKMITDKRSNKVAEIQKFHEMSEKKNGNTVEMVWWFPKSSEQYRIQGRLQFIGSNGPLFSYNTNKSDSNAEQNNNYFVAERKQQWGNLSDMAREQFYWENPGLPFISAEEQAKGVKPGGRDEDGKVLPVPEAFLLMLLYPVKIDYLRLGDNFRQVDEWTWGNNIDDDESECHWKSMRVNP